MKKTDSDDVRNNVNNFCNVETVARIVFCPLIGIVHLSATTYQVLSFNSDLAVVGEGASVRDLEANSGISK